MDKYNSDELQPPSWMDEEFFEKVLKNSESSKDLKVKRFTISPATKKGDHYGSIMFRAKIDYVKSAKQEEISVIIKAMPSEDGKKKDILKQTHVFETESDLYAEIIPKFHSTLRHCGDQAILGTRMLYSSLHPHKVIVLEDLKTQGYTVVDNRPLTFDEMKLLLEKICRWHAISFKLLSEGNVSLDKFNEGVFNWSNDAFNEFWKTSISAFSETLASIPGDQIYYKKFNKIKGSLLGKLNNIYRKSGDFCVLNHGDFHVKNMMTKFNKTGILQEIMLVDFQCCVLAPVAIDVLYLLYMVIDRESRARRDEVIYMYYSRFVDSLKNIGFSGKIPSLAELHIEIMKCRHLELFLVASLFPIVCAMGLEMDMDPEVFMESDDARKIFYKHPIYAEELKRLLPMLLHKGCFDE